jgi:hypothetical protein
MKTVALVVDLPAGAAEAGVLEGALRARMA